ncbi:MAG: TetR/AcrR family transcriptional regulator [Methanobacteriaceae archaeon]|nr:TetR/AcrR family transcriptional regulator [Methanobacteriaceae archaeon]
MKTKEKIFQTSLNLFSEKGYNAVSIRKIATEVGIKESSIYNHYPSKKSILDSILNRFKKEFNEETIPQQEINQLIKKSPEEFYHTGSELFKEKIKQPEMLKIWKILFTEMYQNPTAKEFFKEEMINKPIKNWTEIFTMMIEKKVIKNLNPEKLAREYYGYAIYKILEIALENELKEEIIDEMFKEIEEHAYFLLENIKIKEDVNL